VLIGHWTRSQVEVIVSARSTLHQLHGILQLENGKRTAVKLSMPVVSFPLGNMPLFSGI
jgi:hypothetical protein